MPKHTEQRPEIVNADGQVVRPFDEWLAEFRSGLVLRDISIELHDLISDVQAQEKKGSLTVVIEVSPVGSSGQLQVTVDARSKLPRQPPAASLYYVDKHGNPTRHDPLQSQLPM